MPDVDVLIVGAGPVGLTARALLDRWAVRNVLVEKHTGLSPFPRSRLLNVRSMEIFRQLGIDRRVVARAFAPEYGRVRFRDSFTGPEFASAAMIGVDGSRSTLDAVGEWFTLFTENPSVAAEQAGPWPVRVERLPGGHGTLLVRPDGHIGARWDDGLPGADELRRAQETIGETGLVQAGTSPGT
jgi:hypothetical protein